MGGVAAILVLPASLIVASLVSLPLYLHTSLEKDERVTALLEIASRYIMILSIYHRYFLRRNVYFLINRKEFFFRNKDTNSTTTVTYCMEKWSTVENAG